MKKKLFNQDRWKADVTLELLIVSIEPERREKWAQDRVQRLVMI
jgi:hypothetical protein